MVCLLNKDGSLGKMLMNRFDKRRRQKSILEQHKGSCLTGLELKVVLGDVPSTTYIGDCWFAKYLIRIKKNHWWVKWYIDPKKFE